MAQETDQPSLSVAYAVRGPDHRFVYSNAHRMRLTTSDLSISFGVIGDSENPEAKFSVYEPVTVTMTFTQLNLLRRELNALFAALDELGVRYESNEKSGATAEERAKAMVGDLFSYKRNQQPRP